ncbi:ABC transporter substrate-binding protein [Undibacterium sp.]|uniref:ABC transporter substrate-binding protein n=1 Tax=Undibacterium sp. TaxID=1914977 RepID=UPI00374D4E18
MKAHRKLALVAGVGLGLAAMLAGGAALAEPGITADTITIGQSAGFTGTAAEEVKQATAGAQLYFDIINKQGGLFGRKIVLESLDDGFEPKRTAENTRKLIADKKAFALFLYRGTPTTEGVLPLIAEAKIPLIAPVSGASSLHEPAQHYLFNVRTKYRDEVHSAVTQLAGMGLKQFAVLASNDSFGLDALEGLKESVKKNKLPEPLIASYERNTVAVEGAVKKIFDAKPQAVLLFCTAKPCAAFIKQYREAGGGQQLVTLSNVSSQVFLQGLGKDSRGLGMTQVFPNPRSASVPISKEFLTALKSRSELSDSYPTFEGYISAKVLVEGLKRAGAKPTREGLVTALEGMGGYDMGGLTLNYGPKSRDGISFIELTVIGKDGYVLR